MGSLIRKRVRLIFFVLGAIGVIAGLVFVWQGASKYIQLTYLAQTEAVNTGIPAEKAKLGDVVDTMDEMMVAGDIIRTHRQGIALTYNQLLGAGRYDPTNPKHLSYSQAINLENYLYLGVISFGVSLMMLGLGAFMLLVSSGFFVLGIVLKPS